MIARQIMIQNPHGLHARSAAVLAKKAKAFDSEITVGVEHKKADAKSILDLLSLAIGPGMIVEVAASGKDAFLAIEEICELFINGLGENNHDSEVSGDFSGDRKATGATYAADQKSRDEQFQLPDYLQDCVPVHSKNRSGVGLFGTYVNI